MNNHTTSLLSLVALTACSFFSSQAAETNTTPAPSGEALYYPLNLWNQAYGEPQKKVFLYKNDDNPYIQEFNVKFRAQYQLGFVSANQPDQIGSGGHADEWRRLRLGAGMKLFHDFTLSNVWNMGGVDGFGYMKNGHWVNHKQTRGNLYEATLTYNLPCDNSIGVGKLLPEVLAENRTSSAKYNLPELSSAESQLVSDSSFGVWSMNDTTKHDLGYYMGVWSNTQERSRGTWGTWESASANLGLSYKADKALLDKGRVYLDWIANFDDMDEFSHKKHDTTYVGTTAQNIVALYYIGTQGPFELLMQALWGNDPMSYASGGRAVDPDDIFALTFMPMYKINDHMQAVFRYQFETGDNAIKLGKRYTSLVQTGGSYVDQYQAVALGMNFFLYKEDPSRAKIMTMVEYGNSERKHGTGGFTGWSFVCGAYTSF